MKYKTILADPPWPQSLTGLFSRRENRATSLPYPTMTVDQICALPVGEVADEGCHLWLWTTNEFLEDGFRVIRSWGFKYLCPVTWVKPSGLGAWFVHRTQTILFGYRSPLEMRRRYRANLIESSPGPHSRKPEASYELIESISSGPRIEIFARPWTELFQKRDGWDAWGNEVRCDVELVA
jgi:N6-adenosine-specific RNA methylase IME4